MVTPSHHRVHHDRRVHKNFGGMFIVYDRLFGTFVPEVAPRPGCVFGTDAGAGGRRCRGATALPAADRQAVVGGAWLPHRARAAALAAAALDRARPLGSTATSPEALAAITAVVAVYVVGDGDPDHRGPDAAGAALRVHPARAAKLTGITRRR